MPNPYSDTILRNALLGSLSNVESLGRGFGVAPVGLLGDINALARQYITPRLPQSVQGLLQSAPAAPTTEQILSNIPRITAPRMESSGMEQMGAAMNPRGPINFGRAVASLPSDVARAGQEFLLANQPVRVVAGSKSAFKYPQQEALDLAQQRAALPVEQGGLGLSANNTPEMRMLASGSESGWFHGTTGDITKFRPELLGETTGAQSAKKGFFFARDPMNPPQSMLVKTTDQSSIDMLRKLGIPEEEIAKLNTVSMQGHGAETASGYAKIGGSREYKEAMRKANAAERRGDWSEYEKQIQIAEDSEIKRMNYAQSIVAKYGDARDEMLDAIQKSIYNKKLPQAEAEVLDAKVKELMPYGWYNSYSQPQLEALKKEIVNLVGENAAIPALKQIDNFKSIRAERALVEHSQEGGNVMPVSLSYKNPMVYDFGGSPYRDQTYSDLVDQALRGGNDALILKNTYDPASSASKLIDVGVVFSPEQIRSSSAAFDPWRRTAATAGLFGVAAPDLLAQPTQPIDYGLLSP